MSFDHNLQRAAMAAFLAAGLAAAAAPAARATGFCGLESGEPDAIAGRVKAMPGITEVHRDIQKMCREFAAKELIPNAKRWDEHHEWPTAAVQKLPSS